MIIIVFFLGIRIISCAVLQVLIYY